MANAEHPGVPGARPPANLGITVRQAIREGVRAFSGGRYDAIIEEGTATRAERVGWINVLLLQEIPEGDYCGLATSVGGDPMTLKLRIDRCGCGSVKVPAHLVLHEVGHAMGLFHVQGDDDVMAQAYFNCRATQRPAREKYHASLLYARPRRNRDPDRDPGGFTLIRPDRGSEGAPGRP